MSRVEFIFVVDGRTVGGGEFYTGNEAIAYRDEHHPGAVVYVKVGNQDR